MEYLIINWQDAYDKIFYLYELICIQYKLNSSICDPMMIPNTVSAPDVPPVSKTFLTESTTSLCWKSTNSHFP